MQVTRAISRTSPDSMKTVFIHRLHTSAVEQVEQLIEFMPVGGRHLSPAFFIIDKSGKAVLFQTVRQVLPIGQHQSPSSYLLPAASSSSFPHNRLRVTDTVPLFSTTTLFRSAATRRGVPRNTSGIPVCSSLQADGNLQLPPTSLTPPNPSTTLCQIPPMAALWIPISEESIFCPRSVRQAPW